MSKMYDEKLAGFEQGLEGMLQKAHDVEQENAALKMEIEDLKAEIDDYQAALDDCAKVQQCARHDVQRGVDTLEEIEVMLRNLPNALSKPETIDRMLFEIGSTLYDLRGAYMRLKGW